MLFFAIRDISNLKAAEIIKKCCWSFGGIEDSTICFSDIYWPLVETEKNTWNLLFYGKYIRVHVFKLAYHVTRLNTRSIKVLIEKIRKLRICNHFCINKSPIIFCMVAQCILFENLNLKTFQWKVLSFILLHRRGLSNWSPKSNWFERV